MKFSKTTPADVFGVLTDVERKNAPAHLFLAGDSSLLQSGPRISVVGSRAASAEGLKRAAFLSKSLVAHHMIVVSGLAAGIDTAAHRAAIEAGGRTIAVLGTALDRFYPEENKALQALIMEKHLAVSQFAASSTTHRGQFPQRNRTMALLTDATIVVEAGEKSGTLHQAWEALRLGRLLFLMESVANDASLTWPQEMIHYGAQVLSRSNLDETLSGISEFTTYRQADLRDIA